MMSSVDNSCETVPSSCHYALQVVVESLKNRCQRYRERIQNLEKEKSHSDRALHVVLQDNAHLRSLLSDVIREKEQLKELLTDQRSSSGDALLFEAKDDFRESPSGSMHTDSSSSVELISSDSSCSSVETIISQDGSTSVEPTAEESTHFDVQRALAQALENKRALCRQMEQLEELRACLRCTQQEASRAAHNGSEYSSLDSFEIIGNH